MNLRYFLLIASLSTLTSPMQQGSSSSSSSNDCNGHHASTDSTKSPSPEPQQGPTTTVDHHADSHNGHSGK